MFLKYNYTTIRKINKNSLRKIILDRNSQVNIDISEPPHKIINPYSIKILYHCVPTYIYSRVLQSYRGGEECNVYIYYSMYMYICSYVHGRSLLSCAPWPFLFLPFFIGVVSSSSQIDLSLLPFCDSR